VPRERKHDHPLGLGAAAACPDAFHERIAEAVRFDVGVFDGHLQLMSLNPNFRSWEQFLLAVFVCPIQRLFTAGAPVVVLCFDAYDQVPAYKSMTQLKRVARVALPTGSSGGVSFTAEEALPEEIPEATMEHLMNRRIKLKVVQLALQQVPRMLQLTLGDDTKFCSANSIFLPTCSTICRQAPLFADTGIYLPTQAAICQHRQLFADKYVHFLPTRS
jgi:hypothetical protein